MKPSFLKIVLSLLLGALIGLFYISATSIESESFAEAAALAGLAFSFIIYTIWSFFQIVN